MQHGILDVRDDYVYTDRPVYRPGDTMHFKAILRTHSGRRTTSFRRDRNTRADRGHGGQATFRCKLEAFGDGSVNGEYTIPATATLGDYNINVRSGDNYTQGGSFAVEDIRNRNTKCV